MQPFFSGFVVYNVRMHTLTHREIIDSFGPIRQLAKKMGLDYEMVRAWRNRNMIPGPYWALLVDTFREQRIYLTFEQLAAGADVRIKKPAAA